MEPPRGGGWGDGDDGVEAPPWAPAPPPPRRAPRGWAGGGGGGGSGVGWPERPGGGASPGGWGAPRTPSAPPAAPRPWLTTRERREADPSSAPTLASTLLGGEALYGVAPCRAALAARRRPLHALLLQDSISPASRPDGGGAVAALRAAAVAAGVEVRTVSKHDLNLVTDNRAHQGAVLDAGPLDFVPMRGPPDAGATGGGGTAPGGAGAVLCNPVWLALDEVVDPQNLGAVLRSASFLGASGVVVCARNSAPLSPAASKASAGALEGYPVHSVASLPAFLKACADDGWAVLGAEAASAGRPGAGAGPLGPVDVADAPVDRPTFLVLGSEGAGLRTNVRSACTGLVAVPGGDSLTDSLNVCVACVRVGVGGWVVGGGVGGGRRQPGT